MNFKIQLIAKKENWLLLLAVSIIILATSCSKSTETFNSPAISDYAPLNTGKYITYQLDSLVYISFGRRDTTISYQVKYQVDSLLTDNLGRPAYRIFRYIRKHNGDAWTPASAYMAINTGNSFEFVENNLRFVKLQLPIVNDFSWKGNAYLETGSLNSDITYMDGWDYTYANVGQTETIGSNLLNDVLTVNQRDEVIGIPDNPDSYSEINFGQEKYAKGIGMVYRKFSHKEYQPGNGGYVADGSFGVTYTMIEHN